MASHRPALHVIQPGSSDPDPLSAYLDSLSFVIDGFGHQHDEPDAECDTRVIGDFELILSRGGSGVVNAADARYEMHPPYAILIPPYLPHEIRTRADDPHDNFWLHFDVLQPWEQDRLRALLLPGGDRSARRFVPSDRLRTLMDELAAAMLLRPPGHHTSARGLLIAIVCELVASAADGNGAQAPAVFARAPGSHAATLDQALAYATGHLGERITVADLAAAAGASRSSLYELFAERFGEAPMTVVRWLRLRHAERLLRSTDLTLAEISAQIGIASPFHLSSLFRARYGCSPSAYRRQVLDV